MRAIGYFRNRDGDEGSLQDMKGAFLEYCKLHQHQPVETFFDSPGGQAEGASAYRRMVEYMRSSRGQFLVVVPDAPHLGEDVEAVARAMVELEGMGARVVCMDDDLPDPLQNALHTLGIKGVSRARSERIRESMRARAMEGRGLGKPPYGYRIAPDGSLEVVKEEAVVVELIFRLYTRDGMGLRLIAQHLNERGIPTRRGGQWNVVTIRDILRNPAYMGTYTRFGLLLPKSHQPIIPPAVFRSAQDATRERRPVGRIASVEPFLLSGLVYCSYCGNKMMGVTRRQTWRRKDGRRARGVYRYYQCQSRNNRSVCSYHTWRAPLLEGTVLSQLRYALQARAVQPSNGDGAAHSRRAEAQAMREARVRNAERRFLQALKRAARGEITVRALGEYLQELDAARRAAASAGQAADVDTVLAQWDSLDMATRQAFLMEHIVRINVRDDRVEVIV